MCFWKSIKLLANFFFCQVSSTLGHVLYFDSSPQARQAVILVIRNIFKGYDDGECLKVITDYLVITF